MQNFEKPLMGSRLRVPKFFALVGESWELPGDHRDPLLRKRQNLVETPPNDRFSLGFVLSVSFNAFVGDPPCKSVVYFGKHPQMPKGGLKASGLGSIEA